MRRVRAAAVLAAAILALPVGVATSEASASAPATATGHWLTDASGRVVILHGLNQVYKVAPYTPAASGFGDDDAAFLEANGFDAMRVGLIWSAVEPRPGVYDDAYLAQVAQTVQTLASHGIVSLLDFHQDLYNEEFQGEGAPAWATQDGGLPNPSLGFPGNYFANPAANHAWDAFWSNASAPDHVGLEDHYAATVAHVASFFKSTAAVVGYEVMNEPWPGTLWTLCLNPLLGCPIFDQSSLTSFYQRVATAVRTVDSTHVLWFEPNTLFNQGMPTNVSLPGPGSGFAFHDYCGIESETGNNLTCQQQDGLTWANAHRFSTAHQVPAMLTEFGATNDSANLTEVEDYADQNMTSWLEWAYTGNDITSSSSSGQALVYDPAKPPTGSNVNTAKLQVLARPYPQAVAGTPTSWSFSGGVFKLTFTTQRVDGTGSFGPGSATQISTPAVAFPSGYAVSVSGGTVASAAKAPVLRILGSPGASTITVTVSPLPPS
ncbi:MAG: cellulase family glycosylhydrolase [Marmoricola sp.]